MAEASARARIWVGLLGLIAAAALLTGFAWVAANDTRAARVHVVEIRGFEYHPQTIEIAPGDTVVWANQDAVPHTATAADGGWDSGEVAAGARSQRVFTEPQRTSYTCTLHPGMRGMLVVE